jgi:hypothetical protein
MAKESTTLVVPAGLSDVAGMVAMAKNVLQKVP